MRCFAQVTLDRIFWITGRHSRFRVTVTGREHLEAVAASRHGALFLTAHIGSAAAFASDLLPSGFKLNIAGYYANSARINRILSQVSSATTPSMIHFKEGRVESMLRLREVIEAGEGVVLAADRTGVGARSIELQFLGAQVEFPAGPFLLAALVGCPVFFVAALYGEPDRYDLICEQLHSGITATRSQRGEAVRVLARSYVDQLNACCRRAPYNWFNFYGFWTERSEQSAGGSRILESTEP